MSELRYSLGLGVTWITALGPMSFAISSVFGDDELDETETFQFEIGKSILKILLEIHPLEKVKLDYNL